MAPAAAIAGVAGSGKYDGYAGYEEEDAEEEWWEGQDDAWAAGGYYDEHHGGEWDHFEIDMYTMVFNLDENLDPQEMYAGIEFDDKSLVLVLKEEDIEESSPAAWKSRPLKIHPEPQAASTPRIDRRDSITLTSGTLPTSGAPAVFATLSVDGATASGATSPGTGSPRAGTPGPGSPRELLQNALATPRPDADSTAPPPHSPSNSPATPGTGGSPGGSQSPKIVISNVQLEHLKKKMEFLKQKRSSGAMAPMVLPPAAEEEDVAKDKDKKGPVTSNCPGNHGLVAFKTPDEGWWCSVCERGHKKAAEFFGCRKCDYDECASCARAPVKPPKKTKEEAVISRKNSEPKSSKASPKAKEKEKEKESSASSSQERSPSPKASPAKKATKEKRREASPDAKATPPNSSHKKRREDVVREEPIRREKEPRRDKDTKRERKEKELAQAAAHEKVSKSSREEDKKDHKRAKSSGAGVAAAALAAHTNANRGGGGDASEESASSEEEYRPAKASRQAAREDKRVPIERRRAKEAEHWEPRGRQDARAQEDSGASASPPRGPGAALAAAVRNIAASSRRPATVQSGSGVRLERRAAPERQPPSRASRSRSRASSEEPPLKKRASASSGNSGVALDRRVDRIAASSPPPEVSPPGGGRRARQDDGGGNVNLLRRVLQTNAGSDGPPRPRGRGAITPGAGVLRGGGLKEPASSPEEKVALKPQRSEQRERREPRAPNPGLMGRALQGIASQGALGRR